MPPTAPPTRTPAQPAVELTLIDEVPELYSFYKWRNVHIIVWIGQADGEAPERLGRVTPPLPVGERHSDIHIVANGAGLPSADARAGFVRLMREMADDIACLAVLIEGRGFWASAMRSAIIGLGMLAPKAVRLRVVGTFDDLVGWLPGEHRRLTSVMLDPAELRAALESARARTGPAKVRAAS